MKSKEKTKKSKKLHIKITLKRVITFFTFIISLLYIAIFYNFYFARGNVYAQETTVNINPTKISQAEQVDIQPIINQNVKEAQKEEYVVEETVLEYITKYRNNASLAKGTIQVVQEGRQGKQEITTKKIYQGEELISEEQILCKITKSAVNKIVEIGTANYTNNYKAKVGDEVFVTSDRISVMYEPNEQSQKIATLAKQQKLKIMQIEGDWYKISSSGITGYVKSEATTNIDINAKKEDTNSSNNRNKCKK